MNGVIDELERDPKHKFTLCDMKIFSMWYERLKPEKKNSVKNLLKNGQLEIV